MASRNITCTISSALDDLQLLDNIRPTWDRHGLKSMKEWLRFLRTFLLGAIKWCNQKNEMDIHHPSLAALVARIEDAISKRGVEIHSLLKIANLQEEFTDSMYDVTFGLKRDIESFEQEITECYLVFSDCSSRQSGNSPVRSDDLMEFVDSLHENLGDILHWQVDEARDAIELIKALEEKLTFLKSFVRFVTLRGEEDRQLAPLLTHLEAVAVNVAGLSFRCRDIMIEKMNLETDNSEYWEMLQMEIKRGDYWELLQKIVPVETCKALLASNVSRRSYKETDEHILRDFVVFLLNNLWEILKSGTCLIISLRDQLQMLYEGLRSLRTILKEKPKKFDDEMRDLTGLVFCDAGLVIFSLALNAMKDGVVKEMDVVSFDLLERIKLIKETVAEECPKTSSLNFPRTNPLGFIDSLPEYMMDLTSFVAGSAALVSHPVQALKEDFVYLRSFLGQIVELRNEDEELQELWDHVVEVAYRVEFLIDSLRVGDDLNSCSSWFDSISEEIKIIKAEALKICDSKRLDGKVKEATKRLNDIPSQESKPIINDVVVGFEDEAASIINRLLRGSHKLQIVSIVGMPGLGKTTLARKVYNDSSVNSHFYTRAWCTVSQVYHKKNLLLEILNCIIFMLSDKYFKMSEEDLAEELYRRLKRNKYLIVLDDVWDVEAWKGLETFFPDDNNGSRVIFTSRLRDVAPQDKLDQEPHSLRQLTHDESWKLLKEKLFLGKELPPELCEFQMQIVEMCQGLPLTIVILAGILATTDKCGWKEVVETLSSCTVSTTEQCIATLELSYKNLPENLKPCFLYFGAIPEDHEHTTERLIWLWAAEGFAQQTELKSSEDVANDYVMDLIGRSLVMVSKQRSIGGVKICRIHDLLHEFCVTKAKEENFLHLIRGNDELYTFDVPRYLRRLCINSEPEHFCESKLFSPTIRSLLFFRNGKMDALTWFDLSFIFHIYKLLRVLDVSQIHFGNTFPQEIELLVQLRYLAIRGEIESIPSSIANLCNLETFIVESFRVMVSLPDTIWNLKKLRHLQIKDKLKLGFGFVLPTDNLDNAAQLCDLDTFSSAILSSWENMEKIFRKFPNIRQLKCKLLGYGNCASDASNRVIVLDFLSQLESLNLDISTYYDVDYQIEFQFSLTIRKLTLSGFRLPWCKISTIAELPNLEVLKLLHQAFMGKQWNMEEDDFPKLRFLKLSSSNIVNWTAFECEECFPRLRKLVLERCPHLEEIPSSLGNISTLEMIEVVDCPNSASSVEEVLKEQLSMGNTDMKIIISSSETDY